MKKKIGKAKVQQLEVVRELNSILVLCDGALTIHDLASQLAYFILLTLIANFLQENMSIAGSLFQKL